MVADQKRGLDFVMEVHVSGNRQKDLDNVTRYAGLKIPEYFFFDRPSHRLSGWRLMPEKKRYEPILPQRGRFHSSVLDLELVIVEDRLRFFAGSAELPRASELARRLEAHTATMEERFAEAERQLKEERHLKEEERRLREELQSKQQETERRLQEVMAELERLKAGR